MSRELKDSGVEWIGKIPANWSIEKIKYTTYVKGRIGWQGLKSDEFTDEGPYLVTGKDFIGKNVNWESCHHISSERYHEAQPIQLKENDLLITKDGTIGKTAIVRDMPDKAILNSGIFVTRSAKYEVDFMYWMLNSQVFDKYIKFFETGSTIKHLYQETFENFSYPLPTRIEQKRINLFLNRKIKLVDEVIKNKGNMMTLLEKQRQSIITEAVTKGLNPNVKMKDSGVEWIGEIPEHWEVTKIKYTTYVKGRIGWQGLKSDEFIDKGPFLVTGTDFLQGYVNWDTCYHISEKRYNEAPPIQLQENDLLITKDGTIGKLAIVKEMPYKAILNSGVFVTRPFLNKYLSKYMYWLLSSAIFDKYIKFMETGSTIKHLYQETFVNFSYPIPSTVEQTEILNYLDIKIGEIDSIKSNLVKQIEKLKEYRQALIYEAVTGKIDVRDMELDEVR
ncbi:restriction endonuclease subunit S [Bacillus altitudinis]|uniref:restriction endonuclease subunit S n=1 Tax=Bacillus TaxID=1386 RepID=UPI0006F5AF35|nr:MULTISPECIES: restriction endonuclease subunit S [Bacillus]KQU15641.1 restriction endonuclease subunit S [Bacillus sp. Leaf49]MCY7621156.1 restriction endonuclease subunit S [Bacillus altitudinis]MDM5164465.1 restriction endonuclease subunit S [Bacillus altitudinis]QOV49058.1 restriction endonuclease subunit S [Bacillus altitudinis]